MLESNTLFEIETQIVKIRTTKSYWEIIFQGRGKRKSNFSTGD